MSICYDDKSRVFKLDTANSSYVFMITADGCPVHLHYGAKIDDLAGAATLIPLADIAFCPQTPNMPKEYSKNLLPQEYSTSAAGDYRLPSVCVRSSEGDSTTNFQFVGYQILSGKVELPGLPSSFSTALAPAETLEVTLRDLKTEIDFILSYSVFENRDVIARSVRVVNTSSATVDIERVMSVCLDMRNQDYDFIHLAGSWARERHLVRQKIHQGLQGISSRRTSSSHQHNPAFAIVESSATENYGEVWGCVLVYSGSFECMVELDDLNLIRATAGINPENFDWRLAPGESFQAPEVLLTYSANGLGGMSRNFHAIIRDNLCRPQWANRVRPVLINNWEATYFNFNEEKLLGIAQSASELGIEMLVVDDGWFGHRDDDTTSLGDWFAYDCRIANLKEFGKKLNAIGMKFGLWFEPEMISYESDLYRAHPEWVQRVPGRPSTLGRNQLMLDLTNPEVVEYLFETMSKVIRDANLAYIKWDMNRQPVEIYTKTLPPEKQGEVSHRYVLGVYELKRRLLEAFPELLIEGCSGGGGRFDAGILYYAPQIWTSDDSDAIERVKIQTGTSLFYPASAMSAHVTVVPNHQTGRTTSFKTRGIVALSGVFGYEMDLSKLSASERELVKQQVLLYRKYHQVVANGKLYRLLLPFEDEDRAAWEFVSESGTEVVVTYVVCRHHPSEPPRRLRLAGLEPTGRYYEESSGLELAGSTLMGAGFVLPTPKEDGDSWQFYFRKR